MQVLQENNVRKEELKARALALKLLGKVFQVDTMHSYNLNSSMCEQFK